MSGEVDKVDTGNPIPALFRYYWKFSKEDRPKVILILIMYFFSNLIDFFSPLVIAHILNIVQESGITAANYIDIISWLGLIVILEIGFWLFHGPARVIENGIGFKVHARYKKFLLDGILHMPASWHTNHHSGDTIDKVEKATFGLKEFSVRIYELVEVVMRFTGAYLALIYFNLNASYIVLLFCFVAIYTIIKIDKKIIPKYKTLNRYQNKISAKVFDTISNISTVLILRIERPVLRLIGKKIDEPYEEDVSKNKISEFKWFTGAMFFVFMIFFVIGSYVLTSVNSGATIMVGTLSILFTYTNRIGSLFFRFMYKYGSLVKWRTDINNVEEISDNFVPKEKKKNSILHSKWKRIVVSNLKFKYDGVQAKKYHLDNIAFHLGRKERIAFIGASGSGKTTALKILREMYPVEHIDLMIDGQVIEGGFESISEDIALIPQDPEIFSSTIKENITLGLPTSAKKIKKYTDLAKFSPVLKRLPHGLKSSIHERGVNLSGGEKQRLALARGLLACESKEIVLLDEPTSSVDPKNELEIYQNIFKTFKKKTIVSSIHRLHLLHLFDKIYLFRGGKIAGSGSFAELKKSSPLFRKMLEKYKQQTTKKKTKVKKTNVKKTKKKARKKSKKK